MRVHRVQPKPRSSSGHVRGCFLLPSELDVAGDMLCPMWLEETHVSFSRAGFMAGACSSLAAVAPVLVWRCRRIKATGGRGQHVG